MDSALCPSFQCVEGALIIGVQEQERTSFLPRAIRVDDQFVGMTQDESLSEKFRFAGICSRHSCGHFRSGSCMLIKKHLPDLNPTIRPAELPKCSIRKNCKWYGEKGFYACSVCALISEKRLEVEPEQQQHYYYHRLA